MMNKFPSCFLFCFLGGLTSALLVLAQEQTGFISLDCGSPANSSYFEPKTELKYISDAAYINTGESRKISPIYKSQSLQNYWYLRSFPQGIRNCYNITVKKGTRYLIRADFVYGNYDGLNKLPTFHTYLGNTLLGAVNFKENGYGFNIEIIHVSSSNQVYMCLINIGEGTPFISSLEFRPLPNTTYSSKFVSLFTYARVDIGSVENQSYRFPDDAYDRTWTGFNVPTKFKQLITSLPVGANNEFNNSYKLAPIVMSTAVTEINASSPISLGWESEGENSQYYVYLHFAEVEKIQPNQTRGFNITFDGKHWYGPLIPDSRHTTIYSTGPLILKNKKHNFTLIKIENSTLPPIINAFEIYSVIEIFELMTNQEDEGTIKNIKSTYGVIKDWEGDPCIPIAYPWNGLGCTNETIPRITSLNLSSSGLAGEISPDISNLAMLKFLDLSNNTLNGTVPDFLSKLSKLQVLNLDNNNLTGTIPPELIKRTQDNSLSLSVKGNPGLCASSQCKIEEKKRNVIIPVVASVGGILVIVMIAGIVFWISRSKKKAKSEGVKPVVGPTENTTKFGSSLEIKRQQFTYSEVVNMTDNFGRILGRGGFGMVYHGVVNNSQVAVKMLSPSAMQGYHQFQAEVTILMRVHHRNLTSLVGYLHEGTHLGLIYEYMANGNLAQHLSKTSSRVLTWEDRLRIAMDAAQGLEYLHGCKPPIVHRDVKTTNILLTEDFQGKLSDFGLSKSYPTDERTHMSTVVAGTPGYVDPEYFTSNRLTEKSDVYSFGVALLEIVSSRPVISKSEDKDLAYIVKWVGSMIAQGDIRNIVDPRLKEEYDINSVWNVVEVAMACVSLNSSERPTMSQVVAQLKVCLATELSRTPENRILNSTDSIEMVSISMSLPNQSGPIAR